MSRCEGIKADGERCTFSAQEGSRFCGIHQEGYEGGRPSKYDCIDVGQIEILASYGLTDQQMAEVFAVTVQSFRKYKKKHKEFLSALKNGKSVADANVERSLYHRATGYTVEATKIFHYQGEPVKVDYLEHYPPDTAAAFIWLKNRKPDKWKDKVEHGHNIEDQKGMLSGLMDALNEKYKHEQQQ